MLLACPACRGHLGDGSRCTACGAAYRVVDGIVRLMQPAERVRVQRFLAGYQRVRAAEGWGSDDPDWFRALPTVSSMDAHAAIWRIRAIGLRALLARGLADLVPGSTVLDLGAGCCWLSARLAEAGFAPVAIDVNDDPRDGLGAGRHLGAHPGDPPTWLRVQATFERLPVTDAAVDAAVFNASLHYSGDVSATIGEALRVLRPGGRLVVLDSPIYRDAASGRAMVAERTAHLRRAFGVEPDAAAGVGYLTWADVDAVATALGLRWSVIRPWYGVGWAVKPWRARLRRRREPATFAILVGTRRP